ncbi:diguanylate cyclase [Marichromatium gracile]|uniref:Diguanylate cyclase n=2 Tax=Marichromatium gracile TaxID=1048 RepID=A0ABR5VKP5_MARGR|nr:diguanylate cyclase [Marichromatium gracile]
MTCSRSAADRPRSGGLPIVGLMLASLLVTPLQAHESPVTLQLKWRHQFQFAGYYMAEHLGFYRERGIEVRFREGGPETDVVTAVVSGEADFGVAASDLLLAAQYAPVVALAPIFQHSPYVLLTLDGTADLATLAGEPVMLDRGAAEIRALLLKIGIPSEALTIRGYQDGVAALLAGDVAAIAAYSTTEPYWLRRAGAAPRMFSARDHGIDLYGDMLFTSKALLRDHPDLVRDFVAASLAGWKAALRDPEQAIALILADYNTQGLDAAFYRFEAAETRRLIQPGVIEIGHVNPGRWRHIAEVYAGLGMLPETVSLDGFVYDPGPVDIAPRVVLALIAALLGLLSWRVHSLNQRLRREIVQRESDHRRLAESEALHRLLTENSGDVIWMLDIDRWRFDYVSPSVQRLRGFSPEEVMAGTIDASLTTESAARLRQQLLEGAMRVAAGDQEGLFALTEIEQPRKGGGTVQTEVVTSLLIDGSGRPSKVLGITRDITARKALEAKLRIRAAAIEAAADAIIITDAEGYLLYANPAFTRQTGYRLESGRRLHSRVLKSGRHDSHFYAEMWQTILAGRVWRGELINRRRDGELYEEEMTISPVANERGEIERFIAIKRDISVQRAMERALRTANQRLRENLDEISELQQELAEQAVRDPLTGLYNRRHLDDALARELARMRREASTLVVLMVDIDHFKRINDGWGHPVGDGVLRSLAATLRDHFREFDLICRYGGEEFLVVLPGTDLEQGLARAESVRRYFAAQRIALGEQREQITISIGLAVFPLHATEQAALIAQADAALYRAKRAGRDRVMVADPEVEPEGLAG